MFIKFFFIILKLNLILIFNLKNFYNEKTFLKYNKKNVKYR